MRSVTETEVLVRVGTVGVEVLCVGEDLLVAVRAAHPDDDAFADTDGRARDRGLVHTTARDEQDRRADPQALLDGVIEQGRVGSDRGVEPFDREQRVQEVPEQLAGRRQAAGDEVPREGTRLRAREADTVDLELHQA